MVLTIDCGIPLAPSHPGEMSHAPVHLGHQAPQQIEGLVDGGGDHGVGDTGIAREFSGFWINDLELNRRGAISAHGQDVGGEDHLQAHRLAGSGNTTGEQVLLHHRQMHGSAQLVHGNKRVEGGNVGKWVGEGGPRAKRLGEDVFEDQIDEGLSWHRRGVGDGPVDAKQWAKLGGVGGHVGVLTSRPDGDGEGDGMGVALHGHDVGGGAINRGQLAWPGRLPPHEGNHSGIKVGPVPHGGGKQVGQGEGHHGDVSPVGSGEVSHDDGTGHVEAGNEPFGLGGHERRGLAGGDGDDEFSTIGLGSDVAQPRQAAGGARETGGGGHVGPHEGKFVGGEVTPGRDGSCQQVFVGEEDDARRARLGPSAGDDDTSDTK